MKATEALPLHSITGGRIRALRLEMRLSQADLAGKAGISASYLNLIEHDRRRIAGTRLADLARLLNTTPARLTDGVTPEVTDALAAQPVPPGETVAAFAERFPGWASRLAQQAQTIAELQARHAAQGSRVARDPAVAAALHQIITSASAIQSTSAILVGGGLDADWQGRFQTNVHDDSQRLAGASTALLQYLDTMGDAVSPDPVAEVAEWTRRSADPAAVSGRRLEKAVSGRQEKADAGRRAEIADVVERAGLSGAGSDVLQRWLRQVIDDAAILPDAKLRPAFLAHADDLVALAATLAVPLPVVLRRLAALSPAPGLPDRGLAICDGAGALTFLKPISGFTMADSGGCPLWPLYQALWAPGRPVRARVQMPGERAMLAIAVAQDKTTGFDAPPQMQAIMLVVAPVGVIRAAGQIPAGGDDPYAKEQKIGDRVLRPVGLTCRHCPRPDCIARREAAQPWQDLNSQVISVTGD